MNASPDALDSLPVVCKKKLQKISEYIPTVAHLCVVTERELKRYFHFYVSDVESINGTLKQYGLTLGMLLLELERYDDLSEESIKKNYHNEQFFEFLSRNPLIDDILSVRTRNCLLNTHFNINTNEKLCHYSESDILMIKNAGKKTVEDIALYLSPYGLRLGMSVSELEDLKRTKVLITETCITV